MLLIRRFEEKAGQMYGMGLYRRLLPPHIGQEAVGMQMAMKPGDQGHHWRSRDHGHMLAVGMDANGVMAELTGRRGGYSKGKGGSMAMFSIEKQFFGGHGIVGGQVSLGTGLAFADRYKENGAVSVTYFARRRGQPGAGFTRAVDGGAGEAPVVYVIENKSQGAHGTGGTGLGADRFLQECISFNIPGEQVDGMDVRAVRAAGERALAFAREGNGPYILEMQTYRYRGHSMSDPAKYRSKEEVQKMRTDTIHRAGPAPACWSVMAPPRRT